MSKDWELLAAEAYAAHDGEDVPYEMQAPVINLLRSKLGDALRWSNEAVTERDALRLKLEDETTRRQNAEFAQRQSLSRLDSLTTELALLRSKEAEYGWQDREALAKKLAASRDAYRAMIAGIDVCDATKDTQPIRSELVLDLEDALYFGQKLPTRSAVVENLAYSAAPKLADSVICPEINIPVDSSQCENVVEKPSFIEKALGGENQVLKHLKKGSE
jgi:hypothetical protein